ncbi:MAG: hypothetical protein Q7U14_03595, partial [Lacisediminimonas sp.]|nr:hypothetical protein [Lacisediminimonas sp.]
MSDAFAQALARQAQQLRDACTACGRCFEICPMPAPAGIGGSDPGAVTAGVLDILRGGPGTAQAQRWTEVCSGSGTCIPHCPEAVNPRLLLSLAGLTLKKRASAEESRLKGGQAFAAMTRGVRVLPRLQLEPEMLARISAKPEPGAAPDFVFYTGCQVLKTPHIVLLCLDILDA